MKLIIASLASTLLSLTVITNKQLKNASRGLSVALVALHQMVKESVKRDSSAPLVLMKCNRLSLVSQR